MSSSHSFANRNRFASRAYRGTRNLRAVQQLLGRASIASTERYLAVDDGAPIAVSRAHTAPVTGVVYGVAGQPERWVDLCRNAIAGEAGSHTVTRARLVTQKPLTTPIRPALRSWRTARPTRTPIPSPRMTSSAEP